MVRILVIDDEHGIRRMLRLALEGMGYEVFDAGNGKEGMAVFAKHPADLVITDLVMPEREGIETIRLLRQANPHLKIIAMSGGSRIKSSDNLKMARNLGANAALSKPFGIADLAREVVGLIGKLPPDHAVSAIAPE